MEYVIKSLKDLLFGSTLIGSTTTPTGALGMLAIGAGGLNIAVSMAGEPYYLKSPGM